jgi:hypothetical protein
MPGALAGRWVALVLLTSAGMDAIVLRCLCGSPAPRPVVAMRGCSGSQCRENPGQDVPLVDPICLKSHICSVSGLALTLVIHKELVVRGEAQSSAVR